MTGRLRELFVMQVYGNRKWSATRIWRTGELMGLSSSRAVEIEADLDYRKKITKRREGGKTKQNPTTQSSERLWTQNVFR
jgi:predicted transcriptional regulator